MIPALGLIALKYLVQLTMQINVFFLTALIITDLTIT